MEKQNFISYTTRQNQEIKVSGVKWIVQCSYIEDENRIFRLYDLIDGLLREFPEIESINTKKIN